MMRPVKRYISSVSHRIRFAHLLGVLQWLLVLGAPQDALADEKLRIALLPIQGVNLAQGEDTRLREPLLRALRRRSSIVMSHPDQVSRASAARGPACSAEISCLKSLGEELGVHKLLSLQVGRIMDTTVLRLDVFDVLRGVRQGSWQEVLRRPDDQAVHQGVERLIQTSFPPPPPHRAWYTRWWVWASAGAVLTATAVTIAVVATRDKGVNPDVIITPPAP